jgi:triacylglycerol lipase
MRELHLSRGLTVSVCLALASCGDVPGTGGSDAGAPEDGGVMQDAGMGDVDAGVSDAGSVDAGGGDAGGPDAGGPDAGGPDAGSTDAGSTDAGSADAGSADAGAVRSDGGFVIDGIIFVHGINGSRDDWTPMIDRFRADGWPANRLVANTYLDPRWGCNDSNATQLQGWVTQLRQSGAQHIAVVAHSMGGLSSRYYLKSLMGTGEVEVFTTLGTMHHGLSTPCLSPLPVCVWQQLCSTGPFLADLNAPPATPGPTRWTSIFSDSDDTVPQMSSQLTGADNILVPGLEHDGPNGLQSSPVVYRHVLDTLR